jgi:hypothetical protein
MDIAERRTFASTKRSLLALSHAMERSLEVGRPGEAQGTALLIGLFQRPEYFEAERERYARIAADGAVCIVAFAGAVADVPAGVTAVSLDLAEPLASQWALVAIDGALGIALVAEDAQDLVEGETTLEAARLFTARWSFSPGVAGREATRILDSLGDRVDASMRARGCGPGGVHRHDAEPDRAPAGGRDRAPRVEHRRGLPSLQPDCAPSWAASGPCPRPIP